MVDLILAVCIRRRSVLLKIQTHPHYTFIGNIWKVDEPLPTTPFSWRDDPVKFDSFPQFFLAHEVAHQFWGQAVGWKSYHEQWISEAFAQYFAALYAERSRGRGVFRDLMRQMRRSAMSRADQGPVHLGYRLGHIEGDSRVFRSIVYNKGAMVLHMLRRLVGDQGPPLYAATRARSCPTPQPPLIRAPSSTGCHTCPALTG